MSLLYVHKKAPELVSPSGTTPSGDLPLSIHDRMPFQRHFVEVIMVFDHGREPAQVIREALAKALVPYYPVAGRITTISNGEHGVACTGKGVWFVEASSDCRLEDVDYLSPVPFNFSKEQLLPSSQENDELAIPFMIQVTQFKCGEFVVGVKFNHTFFDGVGVGQFITAIGEMARGFDEPTIKPVWCRDVFHSPAAPRISDDNVLLVEGPVKFKLSAIDIPMDYIDRQKDGFVDATGQKCTTFDVVAAKLWQSRTRAINLPCDADVHFVFFASVRHLHEELPEGGGYYGNCVFPVVAKVPSECISQATFFDVIRIIKDEKQSLPTKYSRALTGQDPPPMLMVPKYGVLTVIDWRRLGLYEVNIGWGGPCHVFGLHGRKPPYGSTRIIKSPLWKTGIRMMTQCVAEEHHEAFLEEMKSWS